MPAAPDLPASGVNVPGLLPRTSTWCRLLARFFGRTTEYPCMLLIPRLFVVEALSNPLALAKYFSDLSSPRAGFAYARTVKVLKKTRGRRTRTRGDSFRESVAPDQPRDEGGKPSRGPASSVSEWP
jgi:hypothetical protein